MRIILSFRRRSALAVIAAALSVLIAGLVVPELASKIASGGTLGEETVILIDAGHGGFDGGATGVGGLIEKDLNLDISLKLRDILRLYGYNVETTRESDISLCDESAPKKKQTDLHFYILVLK